MGRTQASQPLSPLPKYVPHRSTVPGCLKPCPLRSALSKKRLLEEKSASVGLGFKLGLQCVERRLECALLSLPPHLPLPCRPPAIHSHHQLQIFREKPLQRLLPLPRTIRRLRARWPPSIQLPPSLFQIKQSPLRLDVPVLLQGQMGREHLQSIRLPLAPLHLLHPRVRELCL